MTVKDRAQIKQLPDWLRRAMSLPARCRHGHASRVPQEVEAAFNDCLERMLAGFTRDLQSVTNLKMNVLVETAQHIYQKWKAAYAEVCQARSGKFRLEFKGALHCRGLQLHVIDKF